MTTEAKIEPLRIARFRALWVSTGLETIADDASRSLMPLIAVTVLSASALELGLLTALGTAAFLILGIPIGAWVEHRSKTRVMIASDVVRGLSVLIIPLSFIAGHLTTVWILICVATIISVADCFFSSSSTVMIAETVPSEALTLAYARTQTIVTVIAIAAPAITGILLISIPSPIVAMTSVIAYLGSAAVLSRLGHKRSQEPPSLQGPGPAAKDIKEGLLFAFRQPIVRNLIITNTLASCGGAALNVVGYLYALNILRIPVTILLWTQAVGAGAGLVASLIVSRIIQRIGIGQVRIGAALLLFLSSMLLLVASVSNLGIGLYLVHSGLWAFSIVTIAISGAGITPRLTPRSLLSRVSSTSRTVTLGSMPVAAILAGVLAQVLGVTSVIWAVPILASSVVLAVALSPISRWRQFPSELDVNPS